MKQKFCKQCNKELTKDLFRDPATFFRAKYCSRACYLESHKLIIETRKCEVCNKEFKIQSSKKKRTCSYDCALQLTRRIGNRHISAKGYIVVKTWGPNSNPKGYEYEHRMIIEQKLGRKLKSYETVHHKDGNKQNNDINNLELMDNSSHVRHHQAEARQIREAIRQCKCPKCGYSYELYY